MTRVARFRFGGTDRLGVVRGHYYVDPTRAMAALLRDHGVWNAGARAAAQLPNDLIGILAGGAAAIQDIEQAVAYAEGMSVDLARQSGVVVPVAATTTLVPIPNPPKIICVARNYSSTRKKQAFPSPKSRSCSRGSRTLRSPTGSRSSCPQFRSKWTGRGSSRS
ncbi:hypothetical protein GCM10009805_07650 [Leucobacter chromiireducens subsp. solipictus]